METEKELYEDQYEPRIFHVRYGIIVMYNGQCRVTIARMDTEDYPLVFIREWTDDPEEGYEENFFLYKSALTADEADEILDLLKSGEKRKANTLFKRYFVEEGILCEFAGGGRLDDAVPDDWYDVWKEMEGSITCHRVYPGYFEADVEEQEPW